MKSKLHFLLLLSIGFLQGCSREGDGVFQGYIEGEYVYIAPGEGGKLNKLLVHRGDAVQAGQVLFRLDPEPQKSALGEAEQRLVQARSRLADLQKGRRPTEIAALEARLASARVDAEFAESELQRYTRLEEGSVISPDEMDRARTRRDAALASVASLAADLETGRLGGRIDEIAAAEAEVEAGRARVERASWALRQKQRTAPAGGIVDDTFYRVGEQVGAGRPVVSILPPENIKVRFFVPEPRLSQLERGMEVQVVMDGAPDPVNATVSFISTQAEFTPPVIYSQENRAKLVYMIEAQFEPGTASTLHPGQPVDVSLGSRIQ